MSKYTMKLRISVFGGENLIEITQETTSEEFFEKCSFICNT